MLGFGLWEGLRARLSSAGGHRFVGETCACVDRSWTDYDQFWLGKETRNSLQEYTLSDFPLDDKTALFPSIPFNRICSLEIDDL